MATQSMPSAQRTNDLLQGRNVILFPYAPGYLARDILWRVWRSVEEDGETEHLLYGCFSGPAPEHGDPRGELEDFIRTVAKPGHMIFVIRPVDADVIAGLVWFGDIVPKLRANANVWVAKAYRQYALEIGWLALRYVFVSLELRDVWAATPWANVAAFSQKLGFEPIAELPEYTRISGELYPMYLLRLTRKRFANG